MGKIGVGKIILIKMENGKLMVAIMFSKREVYDKVIKDLVDKFGEVYKESKEYDFDKFTDYYMKEMGAGLKKKFVVFKKIVSKKDLVDIKLFTTEIEKKYSEDDKRKVNLDPGYLSKKELVLASFKAKHFKEDLGKGVYAHVVLRFVDGKAESFWHSFRDYKENKGFFIGLVWSKEF